jgi:hypothetical protein
MAFANLRSTGILSVTEKHGQTEKHRQDARATLNAELLLAAVATLGIL